MKMIYCSAAAAAMLVFPVLLSSCLSDEPEAKTELAAPQQETPAPVLPEEVKSEPVLDNSKPAAQAAEKKSEPAPAPAPEKNKAGSSIQPPVEHVVKTGDNLWNISKKYYGSGSQWKRIYEANKSAVKKQDFLEPGTVLVIPAAK